MPLLWQKGVGLGVIDTGRLFKEYFSLVLKSLAAR